MTKRRLLILGFTCISLAAAIITVWQFANSPAEGVISATPVAPLPAATERLNTFHGSYASYQYPASFVEQTAPEIVAPAIDRQWFVRNDMSGWQLSITVSSLPSGTLSDNGDYNFRASRTDRFTSSPYNGATLFDDTSTTGFSSVAFMQSGTHTAAVSLMGRAGKSDTELTKTLHTIVDSWNWK